MDNALRIAWIRYFLSSITKVFLKHETPADSSHQQMNSMTCDELQKYDIFFCSKEVLRYLIFHAEVVFFSILG